MRPKKQNGLDWVDLDDAPPLTAEMRERAEVFVGDAFMQRGRGRPKLSNPKAQVHLRLDHDLVAKLRESGPGWQTKVNTMLRIALGLG